MSAYGPPYIAKENDAIKTPTRATKNDAGLDIYTTADVTILAGKATLIPTGLYMIIPIDHYGRLASQSGLALKKGLEVGAGVIDPDYRGELQVLIRNHSQEDAHLLKGEAMAQLIIEQNNTENPHLISKSLLTAITTERNSCGFGEMTNQDQIIKSQLQLQKKQEQSIMKKVEFYDQIMGLMEDIDKEKVFYQLKNLDPEDMDQQEKMSYFENLLSQDKYSDEETIERRLEEQICQTLRKQRQDQRYKNVGNLQKSGCHIGENLLSQILEQDSDVNSRRNLQQMMQIEKKQEIYENSSENEL